MTTLLRFWNMRVLVQMKWSRCKPCRRESKVHCRHRFWVDVNGTDTEKLTNERSKTKFDLPARESTSTVPCEKATTSDVKRLVRSFLENSGRELEGSSPSLNMITITKRHNFFPLRHREKWLSKRCIRRIPWYHPKVGEMIIVITTIVIGENEDKSHWKHRACLVFICCPPHSSLHNSLSTVFVPSYYPYTVLLPPSSLYFLQFHLELVGENKSWNYNCNSKPKVKECETDDLKLFNSFIRLSVNSEIMSEINPLSWWIIG